MQFAAREQFINRMLDAADLNAAMHLWRHWYLLAHKTANGGQPSLPDAQFQVEVRIWGFGRYQAEVLRAEIARQLAPVSGASVTLPDPDTISLASPRLPLGAVLPSNTMFLLGPLPDPTPYFLVATSPALENACVQFRFQIHSTPGQGGAKLLGNTMVFFGGTLSGRFILRACWPAGTAANEETMYGFARWPNELQFMQSLFDASQKGLDAVSLPDWAVTLFPRSSAASVNKSILWFLNPGGKRRLPETLLRLVSSGAVFAACASVLNLGMGESPLLRTIMIPGMGLAALGFGFTLFWAGFMVVRTYQSMKSEMTRLYLSPLRHLTVDLAQRPDVWNDPGVRKFGADLEAAGGRHFRDITFDPPLMGDFSIRLYLLPELRTVFALSLMHGLPKQRLFPSRPSFLVKTYFTDGTYLVSTNGNSGYRKRLPQSKVLSRVFQKEMDPATMIARHQAALDALIASGKQIAPLDAERIVPLMEEEHEVIRAGMAKAGYYSWDAAFRQVFELVRPEYR